MGAFHTICAFTAAIGKRFADAGLADILIESDIVATGSVSGVLEEIHYNRAVRMHKAGSITAFSISLLNCHCIAFQLFLHFIIDNLRSTTPIAASGIQRMAR